MGKLSTKSTKVLGVIIESKFNSKEHIFYICGKISSEIDMIIKARDYFDKDGLVALYYTFVCPYHMYYNHIWCSTYNTNLRHLVILRSKVVRIISHVKLERVEPNPDSKVHGANLGLLSIIN